MIVIGIDPDSKKHGVAWYVAGKLAALESLTLMEIQTAIQRTFFNLDHEILVSIEDVCANNFIYARNERGGKANQGIARSIGKLQQSQIELERMLDFAEIKHVKHKPTKNNWAKNKAQFEKVTGWKGRSNEDTRSAAYFGWLEL